MFIYSKSYRKNYVDLVGFQKPIFHMKVKGNVVEHLEETEKGERMENGFYPIIQICVLNPYKRIQAY